MTCWKIELSSVPVLFSVFLSFVNTMEELIIGHHCFEDLLPLSCSKEAYSKLQAKLEGVCEEVKLDD